MINYHLLLFMYRHIYLIIIHIYHDIPQDYYGLHPYCCSNRPKDQRNIVITKRKGYISKM
jgi:hypothetical protein